jgi:hypothetical protein
MFALAIPPFFKVERGFYKSSASVFLSSGLIAAIGLAWLAIRGGAPDGPTATALWIAAGLWTIWIVVTSVYLYTLWNENGALRSRCYTLALTTGMLAVIASVLLLKPRGFGIVADVAYGLTAITSSLALGLVSGAMLFGHWYLIDLEMPVDYLRSFVRVLGVVLIADVIALILAIVLMAIPGMASTGSPVEALWTSHAGLLAVRMILGPITTIVLIWMCWQTLKIPQTMAATGLLYIALMSVIVGEMLGRFLLFRTAIPL